MSPLIKAAIFLVNILFDLYIFILILRLFLQKLRASWHNPISQIVIKFTEPLIKPTRKLLPGFKGFDIAIVFWIVLFEVIELLLVFWLKYRIFVGVLPGIVIAIGELGRKFVNVFFYAIIINAIMSWFPNLQRNPLSHIVYLLSEPILRPIRRWLPTVSGFDFSPIVAFIGLMLINIVVFRPIVMYGYRLVSR